MELHDVLEILKLGAIGLCFLLMYLAYRLIRDGRKAGAYLFVTLVLVVGFIAAELYTKPVNLMIAIEPNTVEARYLPHITPDDQVTLKKNCYYLRVTDKENLTLELDALINHMKNLRDANLTFELNSSGETRDIGPDDPGD